MKANIQVEVREDFLSKINACIAAEMPQEAAEWAAPSIAKRVAQYVQKDEPLLLAWAVDNIYRFIYREVLLRIRDTRLAEMRSNGAPPQQIAEIRAEFDSLIMNGAAQDEGAVSAAVQFHREMLDYERKWAAWREHSKDRHILLVEMTKEDLIASASEREQRAHTELVIASTWRTLACCMSEGERVRDRYSLTDIENAYQSARKEVIGE